MRADFDAATATGDEVAACIRQTQADSGYLLDPHTACGVVAAEKVLATGKAPEHRARHRPPREVSRRHRGDHRRAPRAAARLASLLTDPERITVLPNDLAAVQRFVVERAGVSQGAAA